MKNEYVPDPERYDGRMPYRKCGNSGLKLPAVSLGCWQNFGGDGPTENHREMIYTAFDAGITHFDLANNYGPPYGAAELNVGKILQDLARDEIIVSSKAGYDMWPGPYGEGGSRKYIIASANQSLSRLGVDYLDIFYSHRFDPETPLVETLGALNWLVQSGKALYVGISSYSAEQTRQAASLCQENGWARILIHQANYSILNRWVEDELLATAREYGVGIMAFCPLYQGVLSDKYVDATSQPHRNTIPTALLDQGNLKDKLREVVAELSHIAKARNQTLSQMAVCWILRFPELASVVVGASKASQIRENASAVQHMEFTDQELEQIDTVIKQLDLPRGCSHEKWVRC